MQSTSRETARNGSGARRRSPARSQSIIHAMTVSSRRGRWATTYAVLARAWPRNRRLMMQRQDHQQARARCQRQRQTQRRQQQEHQWRLRMRRLHQRRRLQRRQLRRRHRRSRGGRSTWRSRPEAGRDTVSGPTLGPYPSNDDATIRTTRTRRRSCARHWSALSCTPRKWRIRRTTIPISTRTTCARASYFTHCEGKVAGQRPTSIASPDGWIQGMRSSVSSSLRLSGLKMTWLSSRRSSIGLRLPPCVI